MITVLRSLRVHTREAWPAAPAAGDVLFIPNTRSLAAVYMNRRWDAVRPGIDHLDYRNRYVWKLPENYSPTPELVLLARVVPAPHLPVGPLDVFPGPGCSHLDLHDRAALRKAIAVAVQVMLVQP